MSVGAKGDDLLNELRVVAGRIGTAREEVIDIRAIRDGVPVLLSRLQAAEKVVEAAEKWAEAVKMLSRAADPASVGIEEEARRELFIAITDGQG